MDIEDLEFSFAQACDQPAIESLLSECGLPHEDITVHLKHFIVAKSGTSIIGVVGLEVLDGVGLLRSLAVESSYRGRGLAQTLCDRLEDYAYWRGVERLYLLTLTAEGFFGKLGYKKTERKEAPQPIQMTEEFRSICPSTSVCMAKVLVDK